MKTYSVKPADIKKKWVLVDATEKPLGRLCTEIARVLRGKHKPSFVPHLDCGDNVIVTNAAKIKLTGKKWKDKVYYSHTGWVGGIKAITAEDLFAKYPERLVQNAVKGMLPHNALGREQARHLRVYAGAEHNHDAQKPEALGERTAGK